MYRQFYKEFLESHGEIKHFAAHSHHFWPDIARQGHIRAYDMAMKYSDEKWNYAFETLIPEVQKIISEQLKFSRPKDIAFAPNTHDLVTKLISPHFNGKPCRILASSQEFHSISRQLKRLAEEENFIIDYIDPNEENFKSGLKQTLGQHSYDYIFFSHVFFTTGKILANDIIELIIKEKNNGIFVLDGYHHYAAVPFDINKYEDDLFYLGGGYKYAQAGEGMCFMTLPKDCQIRPLVTGWFASFKDLSSPQEQITYEDSGLRFWGSTIDLTPFFRFHAVWNFFKENSITIEVIHDYVKQLQERFILDNKHFKSLNKEQLKSVGHFITLDCETSDMADQLYTHLKQNSIMTDFRGRFLRFGFAPYQTEQDIDFLKKILNHFKLLKND